MSYNVVEEFIIQRGDSAVHYTDVGVTVELTDDEAAELLAAGKIAHAEIADRPTGTVLGGQLNPLPAAAQVDETVAEGETAEVVADVAAPKRGRRAES